MIPRAPLLVLLDGCNLYHGILDEISQAVVTIIGIGGRFIHRHKSASIGGDSNVIIDLTSGNQICFFLIGVIQNFGFLFRLIVGDFFL